MSFKPLKITVLKKLDRDKLFEGVSLVDSEEEPVCPLFEEGQMFEVGADGKMPNGFCTWAWNNIYLQAIHLMLGGDLPWLKEKGEAIACCTDGLRPVIFHLQRVV
jgi:uncharacterized repeat protein (TIGR04076 family)